MEAGAFGSCSRHRDVKSMLFRDAVLCLADFFVSCVRISSTASVLLNASVVFNIPGLLCTLAKQTAFPIMKFPSYTYSYKSGRSETMKNINNF